MSELEDLFGADFEPVDEYLSYRSLLENGIGTFCNPYITPMDESVLKVLNKSKPEPTHNLYFFYGLQLPELLKVLESERYPMLFKDSVLRATQAYFDGLVEQRNGHQDPEIWAEQTEALDALLRGVEMTVVAYYRQDQEIPFDEIREVIMPHDSQIVRHGSKRGSKSRHLYGEEHRIREYATDVANALEGEEIDLIIPVASGGFEPAVLTADYLGVNQLFPVRYSSMSRADSEVLVPAQAPLDSPMQKISGKRILFVDDIAQSGTTAEKLIRWVKCYAPDRVYFAVVIGGGKGLETSGLHSYQDSRYLYRHEK